MSNVKKIYVKEMKDCMVQHGMVLEHKTIPYNETQVVKNLKTNEIIRIDTIEREESIIKVIYLKPTVKVILRYDGKEFLGQATCDPEDIFIAQTGYSIANARAKIKVQEYIIEQNSK